ncbi:TRAP transporter substrate-binding protein [Succinatimonas hippei]|uniref:TRAP transporter substrate-binding protein n=1 Tax=Succinatimonas hippei TaxID=626938 RepID=UPI00201366AF|nr:TRAP transporter substrate-binding protein [Succinatimonas hippei]MCL1603828.1 TRAP transporter substrate-binding protein [Succinatimonas hippei]
MKYKLLMGALALSCVAALSGCSQDDGKIVIRMAQASAADGAIGLSMDNFAKDVEEKSNGRIVVHTFHNGQLGTERENIESVQMGNLDIAVVNQSVLVNFFPDIAVFDLPYTITSAEHADKVFLGEIGQSFLNKLPEVRLHGLAIWESGFRNLTNSKREVNSADDVKGLRIRVMENKIHQDLWGALGADPVPMSWSDAYTGMQQGAIDGQENPATVIDKNNVVEVNKNMAMTEHCYSTVFLVMAPKTWDRLSPEDQKLITDCMNKASLDERALSRKMDKEAITTLESKGMVVTYPDKSLFIERSKPVREFYSKDFPELAAKIEALAN